MIRKLFYLIVLVAMSACGGSSNEPVSTNSSTGQVAVVVTDDFTTDYSEVWVTLYSIQASNNTDTITLYDNPAGEVINLAELNGVGSLLSVPEIPSGTYTQFEITLDRNVTLVTNTGTTEVHPLVSRNDTSTVSFEISGELVVTDGVVTTLAIDFDLSKFTLNGSGQIVPVMSQMKDMKHALKQTQTKIHGEIQSLTDTGFVLLSKDNTEITVLIDDYTILLMEDGLTFTGLEAGMRVKVVGSVDTETLTLHATKVVLDSPDSDSDTSTVELEGTITATDTGMITLNIKHAEFIPESDTITVTFTEATHFCRGTADILAEGQEIEVKGILQADGTISAISIEIEGAGHDDKAMHTYTEIKGSVVSLDGTNLTVIILSHSDGLDLAIDSELTLDITDAFLKNGSLDDLLTDVIVEIKGTVNDSGDFSATVIEILPTDASGHSMPPAMPAPVM